MPAISNSYSASVDHSGGVNSCAVTTHAGESIAFLYYYGYGAGLPNGIASVVWDPTGDNQALQLVADRTGSDASRRVALYVLKAPTSAKAGNIVVTHNGGGTALSSSLYIATMITGVDLTAWITHQADGQEAAPATSGVLSLTLAGATAGELAFCGGFVRNYAQYVTAGNTSNFAQVGRPDLSAFVGTRPPSSSTLFAFAYGHATNYDNSLIAVSFAGAADSTVPSLTGSITIGTVTSSSIQFSWPAGSDNVAVTSYEVSKDGGSTWTDTGSTAASYTFTGLAASTSFALRVRAKDGANNVSTPALAATQSTSGSGAATAVTMTGPTSGQVGVASSVFTFGLNGTKTGTVVVTPSDASGGGTFTPATVNIVNGVAATATYTAGSSGAKTISATNNGSLTNPAAITYTATSSGTLQFQAAGMEFGRRTGVGIDTFAIDAGASYRYAVHADGLTLGSAIYTSAAIALDGAGKLPNNSNALFTQGTTYRVIAVNQATGEAATFRMVAA